jgi:hypothetical protein
MYYSSMLTWSVVQNVRNDSTTESYRSEEGLTARVNIDLASTAPFRHRGQRHLHLSFCRRLDSDQGIMDALLQSTPFTVSDLLDPLPAHHREPHAPDTPLRIHSAVTRVAR